MKLNPTLDPDALHERYKAQGRISIPKVLEEADAKSLRKAIEKEPHRNLVFFANSRHFDIDAKGWADLDEEKVSKTEDIIYAEAQKSFSYYYENIPVYDRWKAGTELGKELKAAVEFLNSESFLKFVRRVTGFDDIAFADAQATLYGPGHFLTLHDDAVEGKNRRAAMVLNLTRNWREDWGGYLNFFDKDGNLEGGFMPTFNTLNMFSVPAAHSVGLVSPFAGEHRVSVTGWLRAGEDTDK